MAEKVSFSIDLTELKDFTPSEGLGSNSLIEKDGSYTGNITKVMLQKSKDGKPMFLVQQIVDDADAKGAMLLQNVLVGGRDRNGDPLARQLGSLLTSIGYSVEQIRGLAATGNIDGEAMAKQLTGKRVYFTVEAEAYEGKISSRIQNYVTKQAYDDAVAANAHRRPRRVTDASFSGAPAGAAGMPAPAGAAATGAKAKDPMAALAGLNLLP